ncbi:enoyl-CoA hydratase/isomerase family protein [bacterium]|nr:enoyl-CoA hydratase/isomerase family protein [bacterium]
MQLTDEVRLETRGPIAIITLARPDKLNALTHAMGDAVRAYVERLNADPSIRVVLVRGEGRAFSAGGDLAFLRDNAARTEAENQTGMRDFYAKFLSLRELVVPSIALIHGRATGAGLSFALGCDMRVAAEDAKVSANFVRVGLNPGMGATYLLERLIGPARAAELVYTGREVEMGEALAIGLVNHIATSDRLEAAGFELAERIAANAPVAVRRTKALMRRDDDALARALDGEAAGQAACFATEDLQEGIRAIQERRTPRFTGA